MARTFAELQNDPNATAQEVVETLEDYANSGAAIKSSVVIELIDRTRPGEDGRSKMRDSAQKGKEDQARRRFPDDASEYARVSRHLR